MIIKISNKTSKEETSKLLEFLLKKGIKYTKNDYLNSQAIIIEDNHFINNELIEAFPNLEMFSNDKYVLVSRAFQKEDSVINFAGRENIGKDFKIIAGPCSVETPKIMEEIAEKLTSLGINIIRGGTYKPRTSPYDFQGQKSQGLKILFETSKKYNIASVSEILDYNLIEEYDKYVDAYQVGARNMQNYELLRELGSKTKKPIILKRGPSATIDEWLMSAEYIMLGGNENIILCERGLKTISDKTRNTLDLSSVIALKELTHLPIIVDPSHGSGRRDMVRALSLASYVVGANGVLIETHPEPEKSLSDPFQAIDFEELERLVNEINKLKTIL